MAITAQNNQKQFELVPAGNHVARCYQMIEIGTEEKEFKGDTKKRYTVRIVWELPNEKKVFDPAKGEQPFSIGKDYTLSMHEKATLRMDLQSWRGKAFTEQEAKAFDVSKLIGAACMLNIIHEVSQNGNTYAKISGVSAMPKGLQAPPQINPSFVLSYDAVDFDSKFATLPDWLKERISKTPEFNNKLAGPPVDNFEPTQDKNDDLPF